MNGEHAPKPPLPHIPTVLQPPTSSIQPSQQPRIPRSAASISYALDQLDKELEEEEEGGIDDILCSSSSFGDTDTTTSKDGIAAVTRMLAAETMSSHPLDFTSQYPSISIITTAALPWLTGTAVNPALRAAYLWNRGHTVSLLVPWVDPSDQTRLFSEGVLFHSQEEQKKAIENAIQMRVPFQLPPLALVAMDPNGRPGSSLKNSHSSAPNLLIEDIKNSHTHHDSLEVHYSHEKKQQLVDGNGGDNNDNNTNINHAHTSIGTQNTTIANTHDKLTHNNNNNNNTISSSPTTTSSHPFILVFYRGRYDAALGSIIPEVDLQSLVPQPVDCIILEEPEHLTWYHSGKRWTRAFPSTVPVIGIMHTNYVDYAKRVAGDAAAGTLKRLNKFLCRMHTHKVVKLSDAVQRLPRQETCFVHGVSDMFIAVAREKTASLLDASSNTDTTSNNNKKKKKSSSNDTNTIGMRDTSDDITNARRFSKGFYFLGKALWAKGYAELVDRVSEYTAHCKNHNKTPPLIDVYGKGEELEDISREASMRCLPLQFLGAKDHLSPDMAEYKAFINPSTSDVVATTSAEALAMGKWLIVPKHPCNVFFSSFTNCLVYATPAEFQAAIDKALAEDPAPLSEEEQRRLSWDAATDRFLHCCASVEVEKGPPLARVAAKTGWVGFNLGHGVYSVVTGAIESVRKALSHGNGTNRDGMSGMLIDGGSGCISLQYTGGAAGKMSADDLTSHALQFSPPSASRS